MKDKIEMSIDPQGWVKLQRSLLDSPIMKNSTLLRIYIWALLKANHKAQWVSFSGKEVHCNVGQFITGRNKAEQDLGIKGSTWYANIKKLEGYGYLTIESNNHFSLITVVNYGGAAPDALINGQQKKKQKNNKLTTKQQPTNTNNNVKNVKNEKKENNNKLNYSSFLNSKTFIGFTKKLQNVYLQIVKLHETKFKHLAKTFNPLKPTQFRLLRKAYSNEDILSTLQTLINDQPTTNRNSLYLYLKDNLKGDGGNQTPTSSKMSEEEGYIQSAFERLKEIIANKLPNVALIPNQLSYSDFKTIFIKYDWDDILYKLKHLEEYEYIVNLKDLNKNLTKFLNRDKEVEPLKENESNSYIRDKKRKEEIREFEIEEREREKQFQKQYDKIKNIKAWSLFSYEVKDEEKKEIFKAYLLLMDLFNDGEYPKLTHLKPLSLKEAIMYRAEHQELEWLEEKLYGFQKSPFLKKHSSLYEFALECTIAEYKPGWEKRMKDDD